MLAHELPIGGTDDCAAARCDHDLLLGSSMLEGGCFALAKGGFALFTKKLRNAAPGLFFDQGVGIQKAPAEPVGDQRANGCFACPGEAG